MSRGGGGLESALAALIVLCYVALILIYRFALARHPVIALGSGRRLERETYRPDLGWGAALRNLALPGWGVVAAGDPLVGAFLAASHVGFALARIVAFGAVARAILDAALILSLSLAMTVLAAVHHAATRRAAARQPPPRRPAPVGEGPRRYALRRDGTASGR